VNADAAQEEAFIVWRCPFIIVALGGRTTLPWVSASSVMWSN